MKSTLVILTLGMVLMMTASAPAAIINYYTFDGNLSDTAPQGTNATNLTVSGTAVTYAADGTRGTQVAVMAAGTELDFPVSNADLALGNNFTVEWWSYSTNWGLTTSQDVLVANNYSIRLANNHGYQVGTIAAGVDGGSVSSSPRFAANVWIHNALVVRSDGTFDYYLDPGLGTARTLTGTYSTGSLGATTSLRLGYLAGGYSPGTAMNVDDMVMYDTALTLPQLTANSISGHPVIPEPATLAVLGLGGMGLWWRRHRRSV